MVFSTCFNGYDAGIMTVILADKQFIDYMGLLRASLDWWPLFLGP
jgi:hypothetical protein